MRVAILGCGPSGLAAAHSALNNFGGEVAVFSRKVPSPIYGAQYLHGPIPGATDDDPTLIRYIMDGPPEAYLRKVYGDAWDGTVSDELRTQAHLAWDIRAAYRWMWGKYDGYITHAVVPSDSEGIASAMNQLHEDFDIVLNTLPRPALCMRRYAHEFKGTRIYAIGDSEDQQAAPRVPEGQILYNGQEAPSWYRASMIHGYATVEWPGTRKPPVEGIATVSKPLGHTCDCWSRENWLHHLGRMGRWQNGSLVHHVYPDTFEVLTLQKQGVFA